MIAICDHYYLSISSRKNFGHELNYCVKCSRIFLPREGFRIPFSPVEDGRTKIFVHLGFLGEPAMMKIEQQCYQINHDDVYRCYYISLRKNKSRMTMKRIWGRKFEFLDLIPRRVVFLHAPNCETSPKLGFNDDRPTTNC